MPDKPSADAPRGTLPEGYEAAPKGDQPPARGGLRVTPAVLANACGCWHVRQRNPRRRRDRCAPYWAWIEEVDPRAPARHRRRAWRTGTRQEVPAGHAVGCTCGDPSCINPAHLVLAERPKRPERPREPGRWAWVGVGEDEEYAWVPDHKPAEGRAGCYARGEGARHAKLTELDVRAIRESPSGSKALAFRYGVTRQAIASIRSRRTWAHVA